MSNIELKRTVDYSIFCLMFDVGRSMFDVRIYFISYARRPARLFGVPQKPASDVCVKPKKPRRAPFGARRVVCPDAFA